MNCFRSKSSESDGKKKISRHAKEKKTASNPSRLDSDCVKYLQGMKLNKNECKSEEQSDQMDVVSSDEPDLSAAGNQNNLASDSANASYSRADSSAPRRNPVRLASVKPTDNTPTYILIPLLKISGEIEEIPPTPNQPIKSSLCKLIEKYPYKEMTHSDIRIRKSYVMSYNKETKNAEWVYEILNKDTVKTNCRETMSFGNIKKDIKVQNLEGKDRDQGRMDLEGKDRDQGRMDLEGKDHNQGRMDLEGKDHDQGRMDLEGKDHNQGRMDLEGKDHDQGHLVAAANHRWCQEAYHDTYLISNMVPQVTILNRGDWRTIENYCRKKAENAVVCNVHVYTGPLYLKEKENKTYDEKEDDYDRAEPSEMKWLKGKAVPTHLFKVIITEKEDGTVKAPECYVMPILDKDTDIKKEAKIDNTEAVKNKYSQHIERIQTLSGLTFIESDPKVETDRTKTITWTGEGEKGELCSAKIKVRISLV